MPVVRTAKHQTAGTVLQWSDLLKNGKLADGSTKNLFAILAHVVLGKKLKKLQLLEASACG